MNLIHLLNLKFGDRVRIASNGRRALPFHDLVQVFLLSRDLKQVGRLKVVLSRAIRFALPSPLADGILQNEVWQTAPEKWTISKSNLQIDAAFMLVQRRLFLEARARGGRRRFLNIDSSPQGGRDWLICESTSVCKKDLLRLAQLFVDLHSAEDDIDPESLVSGLIESHIHPPVALGSKKSGLISKFHAFCQQLFLETGSIEYFPEWMGEVVSITSDLGTESGLSSIPPDVDPYSLLSWAPRFQAGSDQAPPEVEAELQGVSQTQRSIFQRAVLIAGMNHILHNISGMIAARMVHYKWFLDRLKALVHLVTDFADRFLQTCVSPADRVLFSEDVKSFNYTIIEWRWGSVAEAAEAVLLLQAPLLFWDRAKFMMKAPTDNDDNAEACF